jgi:hypothetical protein
MKKVLLNFLLFLGAMWGLEQVSLPTVIAGIGLAMALMGVFAHRSHSGKLLAVSFRFFHDDAIHDEFPRWL